MSEVYTEHDGRALLIASMLGSFVSPLLTTMLNLGLVYIGNDFDVGSHDLGFVNTAMLTGSLIVMVPAGRYSGIVGMKKVFSAGMWILMAASVMSFLSPTFWILIVSRALQGIGYALAIVTSVAMITAVFPKSKRGWAIGINTTAVFLGLAMGPAIGGFICDVAGWRAVFAVAAVTSLFAILAMRKFHGSVNITPDSEMDWKGAALWGISSFMLIWGMVNVTNGGMIMLTFGGLILLVLL